jgi:hypothetical protein
LAEPNIFTPNGDHLLFVPFVGNEKKYEKSLQKVKETDSDLWKLLATILGKDGGFTPDDLPGLLAKTRNSNVWYVLCLLHEHLTPAQIKAWKSAYATSHGHQKRVRLPDMASVLKNLTGSTIVMRYDVDDVPAVGDNDNSQGDAGKATSSKKKKGKKGDLTKEKTKGKGKTKPPMDAQVAEEVQDYNVDHSGPPKTQWADLKSPSSKRKNKTTVPSKSVPKFPPVEEEKEDEEEDDVGPRSKKPLKPAEASKMLGEVEASVRPQSRGPVRDAFQALYAFFGKKERRTVPVMSDTNAKQASPEAIRRWLSSTLSLTVTYVGNTGKTPVFTTNKEIIATNKTKVTKLNLGPDALAVVFSTTSPAMIVCTRTKTKFVAQGLNISPDSELMNIRKGFMRKYKKKKNAPDATLNLVNGLPPNSVAPPTGNLYLGKEKLLKVPAISKGRASLAEGAVAMEAVLKEAYGKTTVDETDMTKYILEHFNRIDPDTGFCYVFTTLEGKCVGFRDTVVYTTQLQSLNKRTDTMITGSSAAFRMAVEEGYGAIYLNKYISPSLLTFVVMNCDNVEILASISKCVNQQTLDVAMWAASHGGRPRMFHTSNEVVIAGPKQAYRCKGYSSGVLKNPRETRWARKEQQEKKS